jgi:O-antigen/teichoic acid export membrane protein
VLSSELAGAARRGALWLGLVNVLSKGSQVVVTLALGVFLTESQLGIVSIAVALLNLGIVLQSAGVFDVIALTEEDPRRFAGTVATVSLTLAAALALSMTVGSSRIALALGAPGAEHLLEVVVWSLPFTAYAGVQMGYVHRQLDFRRRLVPEGGSALCGATVTVACAALGLGAWSMVWGIMTTAVLSPLLGVLMGVKIRPRWSSPHARALGRWASITGPGSALGLVLLNVDYVVIARSLGEAPTGIYSFAYRIAFVPYVMGAVVLAQVAFPVYTRLMAAGGRDAVATALTRFIHVVATATGGLYLTFALLAHRIVVIDPRWEASVSVLQVLCLYGFLLGLVLTGHEALRASGRPDLYLLAQVTHVVVLITLAVVLVPLGIEGVAWAQVIAVTMVTVMVAGMLWRTGLMRAGAILGILRPAFAAGVVALLHQFASRVGILPPDASLLGGVGVAAVTLGLYGGALLALDPGLKNDLRSALRRT